MSNLFFVGIDCSISGSSFRVYDKQKNHSVMYTYTSHSNGGNSKLKTELMFEDDRHTIIVEKQSKEKYNDYFLGYFEKANHLWERISKYILGNPAYIFIEDYAFCGSGRMTGIAEFTALVKQKIYSNGFSINGCYPPTTIKKEIGGKGNLKKPEIYQLMWNNKDLKRLFSNIESVGFEYKDGCWQEDLLDSWAICEYGYREISKNGY